MSKTITLRRNLPSRTSKVHSTLPIKLAKSQNKKVTILEGQLHRCLTKGRRLGYVRMAGESESRALAQLVTQIAAERKYPEDVIRDHPACGGIETRKLLGILHHYRALITYDPQRGRTTVENED